MRTTKGTPTKKKPRVWGRLKLRGRLLTIMLSVTVASVAVCVASFAFTYSRMMNTSRELTNALSGNVHGMMEQAFYQQETHIRVT